MRAAAQRRYTAAHPEKVRQINAEQYAKNKENAIAAARVWAEANRDKTRAAVRKWEAANPEMAGARHAKYRMQMRRARPGWADPKAILLVYKKARQLAMDVDHIVPLQSKLVCGLHVHANLQLLAPVENYSKQNRRWPDMP